MIIINADDWGRSVPDTDAAAALVKKACVTSASAMVFMRDSERAAALACEMKIDVGLHLNFCEHLDGGNVPQRLAIHLESLASFLNRSRYTQLVYNPWLRGTFEAVFWSQMDEFRRLYGRDPSHVDGHRHLHLCANMLVDAFIPRGSGVRRSFTFASREKGSLNRAYRRLVDMRLGRRYVLTDSFFSLEQCISGEGRSLARVADLAKVENVELMAHPRNAREFKYLAGHDCLEILRGVPRGTYLQLPEMVSRSASSRVRYPAKIGRGYSKS